MFSILWEYIVESENQQEFETVYSPTGDWAELFQRGKGYSGTELLKDAGTPGRYITIDHWSSMEDYEDFLSHYQAEYNALDDVTRNLTSQETMIGRMETRV